MRTLFHCSLALAVAACGSSPSNTAVAAANSAQAQAKDESGRPFDAVPVMAFTTPWAMDFLPGGGSTALVSEKEGKLWLVDVAAGTKRQVGGLPDAHVAGQGGLGDVVAHPGFESNRRVYLSFVEAGPDGTSGAALGHGRLETSEGEPRIVDFKTIWRQQPKVSGNGHFSHRIAFAPDGTIFLSSGDRQKLEPAQDRSSDLGKIIHLTAEGERIDGPFHSLGHRNVLGLAFAPDGRLWASEMGPAGGDEINLIEKGRNYGWPKVSYGSHYDGAEIADDHSGAGFEEPKLSWDTSISPAGLIVYSGDVFPAWKGDILAGTLSGQALLRIDLDGSNARKANRWDMGARIREVAQGLDGSVWLLEDGRSPGQGRLLRLEPKK